MAHGVTVTLLILVQSFGVRIPVSQQSLVKILPERVGFFVFKVLVVSLRLRFALLLAVAALNSIQKC